MDDKQLSTALVFKWTTEYNLHGHYPTASESSLVFNGTTVDSEIRTKGDVRVYNGHTKNVHTEGEFLSIQSGHDDVYAKKKIYMSSCEADAIRGDENATLLGVDVDNVEILGDLIAKGCDNMQDVFCAKTANMFQCNKVTKIESHTLIADLVTGKRVKCFKGTFDSCKFKMVEATRCDGMVGCRIKNTFVTSEPVLFLNETNIARLIIQYKVGEEDPNQKPDSPPRPPRKRGRKQEVENPASRLVPTLPVVYIQTDCDIPFIKFEGSPGKVVVCIPEDESIRNKTDIVVNGTFEYVKV